MQPRSESERQGESVEPVTEVIIVDKCHRGSDYQLESDGRTLRLVEYREFVRYRMLSMNLSPTDLRTPVGGGQEPGGSHEAIDDLGRHLFDIG